MNRPLRVLLADDHALFRAGLRAELSAYSHVQVVGEASSGHEALELALRSRPDVVLMDITMPGGGGLEALEALKREMPQVHVVMLSVHEDDDSLLGAIRRGADGYLTKDIEPDELLTMLDKVTRGEPAIAGTLGARLLQELRRPGSTGPPAAAPVDPLTARELEVLRHVAKGDTNAEIGQRLFITENTVKMHLRNILDKLQLENRVQAAVYAVQAGLVQEEYQA